PAPAHVRRGLRCSSQHHVDATGRTQIDVDRLQLLDTGGGDQYLYGEEAPVAAISHHQRSLVEIGRVTLDHFDHRLSEALACIADHLDRVTLAGELDFRRGYFIFTIGHSVTDS